MGPATETEMERQARVKIGGEEGMGGRSYKNGEGRGRAWGDGTRTGVRKAWEWMGWDRNGTEWGRELEVKGRGWNRKLEGRGGEERKGRAEMRRQCKGRDRVGWGGKGSGTGENWWGGKGREWDGRGGDPGWERPMEFIQDVRRDPE